ncbi:MarR family winged helix-turn-helix transcriptional regulator [Ramlibacter rhizophilus]|uniref:MarR family transcriptional regulator n=1 Tax=Ramlibacter rhizophilus TaxID=1781167 RepID=A0A4Z0BF10_9BURK|nr:MarR family transcriptional regulator [Ramlibacter rhizophilus]TFY97410.1 MarR family transcriptional regulator [Ramlibacter rhizophilus]
MNDLFLFRLHRMAALAGQPLVRLCEGRHGITRREWRLILTLGLGGPMLSTQLAERARIEPARTSRAVTVLAEKGLVVRAPRPNDRRRVEIRLTERGRAIFDELHPTVLALDERLLGVFSPQQRQDFQALFDQLEAHLGSWRADLALPKANRSRAAAGGAPRRGNP